MSVTENAKTDYNDCYRYTVIYINYYIL